MWKIGIPNSPQNSSNLGLLFRFIFRQTIPKLYFIYLF